jgi:hypothetical protein
VFPGFSAVYGQSGTPSIEIVPTKIEALLGQTGIVVVKAFTRVGSMQGNGGSVEVLCIEVVDATNNIRERGVSVRIEMRGQVERTTISYIDRDIQSWREYRAGDRWWQG